MTLEHFQSLPEVLAYRARESRDKTAFTFEGKEFSFSDLWHGISRVSVFLIQQGLQHGDRVVVALPNGSEFFSAFYGILQAGGIAVPLFPASGMERILSIARLCEAHSIVLPSREKQEMASARLKSLSGRSFGIYTVAGSADMHSEAQAAKINPKDTAFIQFTSGSTGNPKGVQLSHENLITNINQMIAGMQITPSDIFVSWLPVYHDMGLILMTMVPFYLAAVAHILPTNVRNILDWLRTIQAKRATFTAAPDFAYRMCLRYAENPGEFDLSSLRVALNAAEPVRFRTVDDFEKTFMLNHVMTAGYGLAEATVGVSMSAPGAGVRTDSRGLVSVGGPFPGIDIHITQNEHILPRGKTGEIAIRSIANSCGYFNNKNETDRTFGEDGYIKTGDLGYLDQEGELFIVGRKKAVIKRFGETIAPQEIEEVVDGLRGIRFSAAVGIDKGGFEGEQVYVFSEVQPEIIQSEDDLYDLALKIVQVVRDCMGFRPGRVYIVEPHSIPRTHNGKIQHTMLKERFLDGSLRRNGSVLFPEY